MHKITFSITAAHILFQKEDIDHYGANCENVLHLYYNLDVLSMIHIAKLEFLYFLLTFLP